MMLSLLIFSILVNIGLLLFPLRIIRQLKRLRDDISTLNTQLQNKTTEATSFSTELTELKTRFDDNVLHDSLTGLPSRQVFEDRLMQTLHQSKRHQLLFGVLFLDINGFKMINNALGYDVGDQLLKQVAERLKNTIRKVDTVCRFNGDEFVVLLPQIAKPETCVYIAQRLLEVISQPFIVLEKELYITASVGITIFPTDGEEMGILIRNADNALQQAKARGCNTYQFYREEMNMLSQRELALNLGLRNAAVYQEFIILYQPEVDVKSQQIICMEALLRWQHPDFGLIAPLEFLRLAEYSGKIIEIGDWVLRTACQQFDKWQKNGFALKRMSVNISIKQLENPHFIYKLSQILQETNMKPDLLVLEISEGGFHKTELLEKSLKMLKNIGVQIAIDEFGTGRLSLQELMHFSIDYLKIDGALIKDITTNPENEAIVKMIIALATTLRQGVVANRIETREQKDLLEKLGCHVMQGYFFSVPRPAADFTSISYHAN